MGVVFPFQAVYISIRSSHILSFSLFYPRKLNHILELRKQAGVAINSPEKMVLAENLDHNLPDRTKRPCLLRVYLGLLSVLGLLNCLSVLNARLNSGKSKNKLALGRAITFLEEGRNWPCAYYFRLVSGSVPLLRSQMQAGRPPLALQCKEATEAFWPGIRKGNLFAFKVLSLPIEMKGKLRWFHPCGITKVERGALSGLFRAL